MIVSLESQGLAGMIRARIREVGGLSDSNAPAIEKADRFYSLLFAAFSTLLLVLVGYFLHLTYRQTERAIEVASLNEAHILSARTDTILRHIESTCTHVAEHFVAELRGGQKLSPLPQPISRALTALTEKFPETIQTQVFDAEGSLIYSSLTDPVMLSIADRDHFREMKERPDGSTRFTPVLRLKSNGRTSVLAYRAIIGTDGKFLGLVSSAIDLAYFARLFSELEVGESGMVSIRRSDDSRLVVRWPVVEEEVNKKADKTPPYLLISQGNSEGVIRYVGKSDGVDRIFAFFKIPEFPFYVLVGRGVEEQFAPWRKAAAISLLLALGAIVVLWLMLGRLLQSEKRTREARLFLSSTQAIARVGGWKANPSTGSLYWTEEIFRLIDHPLTSPTPGLEAGLTYYAPEYSSRIKENLGLAWENGTPFSMEVEVIAKTGRRFWCELRCVGRVSEGKESYLTGTLQDISERKATEIELDRHRDHLEEMVVEKTRALEASESNVRRILESSADGLFGMDNQGRFTFINPAACAMLGQLPELVIGKEVHPLIHHSYPDGRPYPDSKCPSHKAIAEGLGVRVDNEVFWHADGHPVPVMYAAHPIIEGGATKGAVVSFVDVSYQRAAEKAKEEAMLAAEKLGRARSEFLANMSHEIRTPLTGVIGFADIGYRNALDGEQARNAFSKIRQSGRILLGVINDILDFSKIEAGKLNIDSIETSIALVVGSVMDIVSERAREKSLTIHVVKQDDLPDGFQSDPIRIQQILVNLLTNAIKFTDAGNVSLEIMRENQSLIFRISDTGIGISEEQLSRIFTPFEQADGSTTRKFGGTGLGLAIVKRIVDLMGGEIRVSSILEQGSTFEVSLPFLPVDAAVSAERSDVAEMFVGGSQPLRGIRILVAEDNEISQEILVSNLLDDGASVVAVCNGRAAVDRIIADGGQAYDIVLMDIQMPEMNGHEATREILRLAPGLPVVGQTAHAFTEEINACFESGMVGYIGKPVNPKRLAETVLEFARRA